ncbi:MAG: ABC transporter ATP-binding protein [Erysipelotrichaceae bacterium]|jgi:NitT/TauT family transport system ATP-binding protein|nr:ABC transporter ATP-binding protein [Erysipelotrichaceae bacterium]
MTMIEMKNISKSFTSTNGERIQAIKDVSLSVEKDEFISIIGPSGCGKSTLLRILSELQEYDSGEILFHDENLKDNLGFVFQDSVLLPWKSVYENIVMPLKIKHMETPETLAHVEELLDLMNLKEFRNSLPKELSGGMKQRTSIARSLSYNPKLLLMDEPFGALDAMTRDHLNLELRRLWKQTKKTILFVTHDIEEAVFLSTRVVVLSNRPSTIHDIVTIDLPEERTLELRDTPDFINYVSRLRGMLNEQS